MVARGPGAGTARSALSPAGAVSGRSEQTAAQPRPHRCIALDLLPPAPSCTGLRWLQGSQGTPVSLRGTALRGTRVLGTGWQPCHVAKPQGIPEMPWAPETLGATAFWDLNVLMTATPAFSPRQPPPCLPPPPHPHSPGGITPCLLAGEQGGQWGWGPVGRGVCRGDLVPRQRRPGDQDGVRPGKRYGSRKR